jgi:MFS family permease
MNPWWSAYAGNWIGAIGGSAIGVLGGILGLAAGWLAPRGRGKGVIFAGFGFMLVVGAIALCAGLVALATGQPRYVWYPLVLIGGIILIVVPFQLPALRGRYRQAELRRLQAEELRRA